VLYVILINFLKIRCTAIEKVCQE